ncbi:MAG: hypothetical protein RL563_922 [Pseudomonadota bacterium]|jgi:hydroxypyruvate reductase
MAGITQTLRAHSLDLFKAGIAAADPRAAVSRCLQHDHEQLCITLDTPRSERSLSKPWPRIHLIAFGKAACAMISAARVIIPSASLGHAIAVTTEDNLTTIDGVDVYMAGHPLPNAAGLHAAQKIANALTSAKANELVLTLISGGGSALLPYPVAGLSLDDKTKVTQQLLSSGADIHEINCVRKHLSRLKGGGLVKLAYPADVHALILSDVLDDDLSTIASGPTVADPTTFGDAIDILKSYQCWELSPQTVRDYLEKGACDPNLETLKPTDQTYGISTHTLIGSNRLSIDAVYQQSQQLGYQSQIYSHRLCGEARTVAEGFAAHCRNLQTKGLTRPTAIIAGGETTVTVTGRGKGGRNQEMALAFALAAENIHLSGSWCFLSGGTDGRDGPTDAAGGLVDSDSLSRMRGHNLKPQELLEANDAYNALQTADDLIITGGTGTNVADLQIALLHPQTESIIFTGEHHV